jgi:hypothetical protein
MADENSTAQPQTPAPPIRSKDELALEMMKFIAVQTGYGRGTSAATGFSGKPVSRSPEDYAEALIQLFQRCRGAIDK